MRHIRQVESSRNMTGAKQPTEPWYTECLFDMRKIQIRRYVLVNDILRGPRRNDAFRKYIKPHFHGARRIHTPC